jgi:hypothetical protein
MSADEVVFWFFAGTWVIVALLILFVQVPRIVSEGLRIVRRVMALVNDSPLPAKLDKAEADAGRIEAALDRIPALRQRAEAALTVIRTTRLVPPAIGDLIARIRTEIRDFRRAAR